MYPLCKFMIINGPIFIMNLGVKILSFCHRLLLTRVDVVGISKNTGCNSAKNGADALCLICAFLLFFLLRFWSCWEMDMSNMMVRAHVDTGRGRRLIEKRQIVDYGPHIRNNCICFLKNLKPLVISSVSESFACIDLCSAKIGIPESFTV